MPFPPRPPPAGVPAARPAPRRPRAPPAAAAGDTKRRSPEPLLSSSWPSATLRRPPGPARAPAPASPGRAGAAATCSPPRPACARRAGAPCAETSVGAGAGPAPAAAPAARLSLSLTPEALRLLQRRHLEKQLPPGPRRPVPAPPSSRARPGPRAAPPPSAPRSPRPSPLRPVLKVSLLNDQHRYDDVEYEEEAVVLDAALVRKCTEWLRGVESAAATRDRVGAVDALPHLHTL
ncbi:proline-rich protein 18 [Ctenodactylus gundi]